LLIQQLAPVSIIPTEDTLYPFQGTRDLFQSGCRKCRPVYHHCVQINMFLIAHKFHCFVSIC
jgi:hypothetical protein